MKLLSHSRYTEKIKPIILLVIFSRVSPKTISSFDCRIHFDVLLAVGNDAISDTVQLS